MLGLLITFLLDIEQVTVVDPAKYGQPGFTPLWPPEPCVRAIHWWGRTADGLVLARPVWFRVAIWLEVLVQAPFYALAILAFARSRLTSTTSLGACWCGGGSSLPYFYL